ncbi:unnamed protein product, partial [Ectocarpus sp. 12 AP-2014]
GDYRQVPQCFRHARASCSRRGAKPDQGRGDGWGTPQGRVERDDADADVQGRQQREHPRRDGNRTKGGHLPVQDFATQLQEEPEDEGPAGTLEDNLLHGPAQG